MKNHLQSGRTATPVIARTKRSAIGLATLLVVFAGTAAAEEGGSGHYLPGSIASFIDAVPPQETFIIRLNVLNYNGAVGANVAIPVGGMSAIGVDANSSAYGLTLAWRPPVELGVRWSYAMSATIPYVTVDVAVNATTTLGGVPLSAARSQRASGLGDVVLLPLMLNYNVNPDLNYNFRLAAYAPTGSYEVGRLANTGKNFWTIEPTLGLVYFGQKNGIEGALYFGADFNQENPDTHYKSGTQLHLDGTLAQHFPLAGSLAGVGVSGFYYEQVTGDSGSGATFGDFKAKSVGAGPALSYVSKLGGHDLIAELKWLHEFETRNRLEGDTIFLKVVMKF